MNWAAFFFVIAFTVSLLASGLFVWAILVGMQWLERRFGERLAGAIALVATVLTVATFAGSWMHT